MKSSSDQRSSALLQQRSALASFGELSLKSEDLDEILTEACRLVSEALDTDMAKVMELRDDGNFLFVRAGVGWKPGVVGEVCLSRDPGSSEGRALDTGAPVISRDIATEDRFEFAEFLKENGVRALVNVIIIGGHEKPPFGILQVDSREPRDFNEDDISFLRTYANLLAAAVDRMQTDSERRSEQRRLAASELRLRTLVEGIPQLVWRSTAGGNWSWASPQWQDYTGQSGGESLKRGWLDALHPDDRPAAIEAWSSVDGETPLEGEYRIRDAAGDYKWHQLRAAPALDEEGAVNEWFGTATDIDELRRLQTEQQTLVAELQHRTRNLIGVVDSVIGQTLRGASLPGELRSKVQGRLQALSRVQGLLSQSHQESITLERLITLELEAMAADRLDDRIAVAGPHVCDGETTVHTLALVLHELATNARKYGALKQDGGRLKVGWESVGEGRSRSLVLTWREEGISIAADAELGAGFGFALIKRAIPHQLNAKTGLAFGADWLECTIELRLKGEHNLHV